jgi:hypothetical protein
MKFTLGFILGAAAAAVIVQYLNSEEGEAMVEKVKKDAGEMGEKLTSFGKEIVQEAKTAMGAKGDGDTQTQTSGQPEPGFSYNNIN